MRPPEIEHSRACLKKAFCKMCVTVCGRFFLNEGGVAGYVNRMKVKYAAKWGVQIAGMIFQTRSSLHNFNFRYHCRSTARFIRHRKHLQYNLGFFTP